MLGRKGDNDVSPAKAEVHDAQMHVEAMKCNRQNRPQQHLRSGIRLKYFFFIKQISNIGIF